MSRRSTAISSGRSVDSVCALAAAVAVELCGLRLGAQAPPRQAPNTPARTVSQATDHLTVSATLSAVTIGPGRRVTLTAEVKPKTGIHVYAPGSQYRAVAIKLEPQSPFRTDAPVEYPKPVLYTFKPLNEQVLVYDSPFRLVAQIVLDPARPFVTPLQRPASLALNASLDYQACDDRVCYLPESVPLRWTVTLLPTTAP
jgi:hypothetical protein